MATYCTFKLGGNVPLSKKKGTPKSCEYTGVHGPDNHVDVKHYGPKGTQKSSRYDKAHSTDPGEKSFGNATAKHIRSKRSKKS
jgi:hypothetical protein